MATQIELQDELKKYGVELTGKETYRELQAMLKAKREEIAAAENKGDENGSADQNGSGDEAGDEEETEDTEASMYVWVKSRAYVADKKRIEAGLFHLTPAQFAAFPRLQAMGTGAVEVFKDGVPPLKLAEIAKWCGVNPDKYRSNDKALLKLVVTQPVFVR